MLTNMIAKLKNENMLVAACLIKNNIKFNKSITDS